MLESLSTPSKVAEVTGLDKKVVDKVFAQLKRMAR